ncbi:ssk1 response regulator receiver, partial [Ceratobasidium sp. 414]
IVRQIIAIAKPGDTIELGLHLDARNADSSVCIFDIIHRLGTLDPSQPPQLEQRVPPQFDTIILRRLLTHIRATLQLRPTPVPSPPSLAATTTPTPPASLPAPPPTLAYTLLILFKSASLPMTPLELSPADESERQPFPTLKLAREPTLEELTKCAGTPLRGKHATFYVSAKISFAYRLTSYLTSWGMNVEHQGVGVGEDDVRDETGPTSVESEVLSSGEAVRAESILAGSVPTPNSSSIIIDDDVTVLRQRLPQIRRNIPHDLQLESRKRPSLAANNRPRSPPRIR